MDPFISQLNDILKYGRLRSFDEWIPLKDQMTRDWTQRKKHGLTANEATAQSRSVFADFLADEGDPREHILRGEPAPGFNPEHLQYPTTKTPLVDGTDLSATVHPTGKVELGWGGGDRWWDVMHVASSMHSPDEARDILSKFSTEHAPDIQKLHELIDRHFPKKASE